MHPTTAAVLVGFSNTTHVDEAVACADMPRLSEEQMAEMRKLWETDFSG
jgi:aryl-alcohol dehydrogenase-like predicted oxidoreductase